MKAKRVILRDWQSRALQDGRLSLLVLPLKEQFREGVYCHIRDGRPWWFARSGAWDCSVELPHQPGQLLWVAEAFYLTDDGDNECAVYVADEPAVSAHINEVSNTAARLGLSEQWLRRHVGERPPSQMPCWASRWTLRVTDVAVKRVQDVSEEEARACGHFATTNANVEPPKDGFPSYRSAFAFAWDAQRGKSGLKWASNPWVELASVEARRGNVERVAT